MALIKTPDGGFYVEDTQFTVDYEANSVTLIGEGGGVEGQYLPLTGGNMDAGAEIGGTDELTITVPDAGESATVGITPEGVTLVHNTNSEADSSIRVIENSVEIMANGTTVTLNGTGVNFGAGALSNIGSIGASTGSIAFENAMDMNNHGITNLTDPVNAQDAMTKNYGDSTYATLVGVADFITLDDVPAAGASTAGLVRQGVAVTNATGAEDVVTQFNALLASLRAAGIIAQ